MPSKYSSTRRLGVERLEARLSLSAQSWNMATDFAADFVGGLPQDNPNGVWSYLASDGTTSGLVATNGVNPVNTFGVGAGWAEADGIPSYARGGAFGFPTNTVAGHGPDRMVFTAPADLDMGGVELTGIFTQAPFEPTRQMQLRIYKNNAPSPFLTVDANFVTQNALVPLPTTRVAMDPGDTLTIKVDGSGPQGNGIATFAAWNVAIDEIDPQIDADFNGDFTVNPADLAVWQAHVGMTAGAAKADGDANGDGAIDGADLLIWQRQLGNSIDSGAGDPLAGYHPGAIIVQTTGVTLPDGSLLDTSGSQTQGIQEAFDYSAAQGWDMFFLPGTYTLNAHLDIAPLQGRTFRFEDVTFNFTSAVTDYGIRFDSTMLTNLYWKGGAFNAPNATDGILYQPRSPHPADGIVYGTKGVVDSYFQFNVDITAGSHPVTMNTNQATINDVTLFFKNVARNQINYVGSGFAAYNIFEAARTDDPIPFDLFNPAGRVTVSGASSNLQTGKPATVYLPDGSILDISGTQTFGVKEAFDYAAAHNLDLLVFGRGVRNIDPLSDIGSYNLNVPLNVADLTNRTYRLYGGTLNFPIAGETLKLGDIVNSSFEFTGQVVAPNADSAVVIRPDGPGVQSSSVRIQAIVGNNGSQDANVRIDPSLASIQNNLLYMHEVNTGFYGIKIMNPSATTVFSGNLVRTLHTHATAHIGVQVGESATNSDRINNNTIDVRVASDTVSSEAALQVWGDYNTIDLVAYAYGATRHFGAKFEPGSNNNTMYYGVLQASIPIANYGTNNTFISGSRPMATVAVQPAGATLLSSASGAASDDSKSTAGRDRSAAPVVLEPIDKPRLLLAQLQPRAEDAARDAAFDSEGSPAMQPLDADAALSDELTTELADAALEAA